MGFPLRRTHVSLASVGLGLRWSKSDRFTAHFDRGIPLVSVNSQARTWQEHRLYSRLLVGEVQIISLIVGALALPCPKARTSFT
ncbi:hypothetical protein H6G33_25450 [Calothrix sp. FACHB-1219]|uniref:hypothetical protein n=1 Tax=unclassified Calothrix TaxID=2619626 RepID=UPI001685D086|nr:MULTISPECIES: hypothetical protein [unclassified Calothrix]MBD2206477.1 hypothetical protein [Calothrix sp. FACHB-168]MBD2220354.1 hypothetical protein [Calothrix sp. FACHB-1219]